MPDGASSLGGRNASGKLRGHVVDDDTGSNDLTPAGQAEADLSSAAMALEDALKRDDLTFAEQQDFHAALRGVRRAWRSIARHVDVDLPGQKNELADA